MPKKKRFTRTMALIMLSAVMVMAGTFGALADDEYVGNTSGWQRTGEGGWRYIKPTTGGMARDEWVWIGEESTGFRCYFFDNSGNLVVNAITTSGAQVDESGAWVENGTEVVRMYIDNTRAPFGTEITNGYSIPTMTLSSYMTSLIDEKNSAAGFLSRKYIQTMDNGDVLFYAINNGVQIKIQTNGEMVVGIEAPANLIFNGFPETGIEENALRQNIAGSIMSTTPTGATNEELAAYFDSVPYSFSYDGMVVMADRQYEVYINLTQGTNGLYYIYPSNMVYIRMHIDFNPYQELGPGV